MHRMSFTSQLTAGEGGYQQILPSVEQPTKPKNRDGDSLRIAHYHRSVSGSLLSRRERELRCQFFLSLHLPSPRDGHPTPMFNLGHGVVPHL